MSNSTDNFNNLDKVKQLEAENQGLRKENAQLKKAIIAADSKFQDEIAIEEKYRESQNRFETIFNQSVLGNKIIAPDLKIIQVNNALQQMLGYTKEELIDTKITNFSHPDFIDDWLELQTNLWQHQIPAFQIETCLIKKNGVVLWCQVTSILFRDQNNYLGFTLVQDINNRKLLELELQKQYDSQETIMHMVAHDLKSPLYNIKLAANFLKENLEQLQIDERERKDESFTYVNLISETSDKALIIIKDLILIGDLESSYKNLEQTDLKTFIQSQLNIQYIEAQKKNIQIDFDCPEDPVYAQIEPEKFVRVLENLLSNAVKFTKANGRVTVSLRKEAEKTLLQVQDTGIGIPDKLQATIFNKFTKASRPGTDGEPTTGLGLYIAKKIVENHEGRIWVESQENVGTTFFIELG